MEALGEEDVSSYSLFILVLDGGERTAPRPSSRPLPPGKGHPPQYKLDRRLGGPVYCLGLNPVTLQIRNCLPVMISPHNIMTVTRSLLSMEAIASCAYSNKINLVLYYISKYRKTQKPY